MSEFTNLTQGQSHTESVEQLRNNNQNLLLFPATWVFITKRCNVIRYVDSARSVEWINTVHNRLPLLLWRLVCLKNNRRAKYFKPRISLICEFQWTDNIRGTWRVILVYFTTNFTTLVRTSSLYRKDCKQDTACQDESIKGSMTCSQSNQDWRLTRIYVRMLKPSIFIILLFTNFNWSR